MSTSEDVALGEQMLASIRGLPEQFAAGLGFAGETGAALRGVRRVVVCGMGGSAFPADLLRLHPAAAHLELTVSRDYVVHDDALGPDVLVIASSFSGGTEETLSALDDARARGARVAVVTAGGRLAEVAQRDHLPWVRLERPADDFQPRAATGFFVGAFAGLLHHAGLMSDPAPALTALAAALRTAADVEDRACALARRLRGRVVVIYATHPFADVARVAKIKLNENAKTPAFSSVLPEMNHNEMCGFTRLPAPFAAVMLRDPTVSPRMSRRIDVTRATLEANGVPVDVVDLEGNNAIERAFGALHLFDFASWWLAVLDGVDPNPVEMIEDFKRRLGQR